MIEKFLIIIYIFLGFSFALSPLKGFDLQIIRILIPIVVFLWFFANIIKKEIYISRGFISFFFTSIFLWSTISLVYSDVTFWTLRKLIFFYSLAPLFYVLVAKFKSSKFFLEKIIFTLVLGGTLISVVGIIQFCLQFVFSHDSVEAFWMKLTPFFLGGTFSKSVVMFNSWYVHVAGIDVFRAIAFFPDPHVFSYYTGAILPFPLFLYIKTKQKKWLLSTFLLLSADLLTFSRGGEIALLAGFLAFLLLSKSITSTKLKHFMIIGVITGIFFLFSSGHSISERFVSSFNSQDKSVSQRFVLWKQALEVFEKHPILGVGLGAYSHEIDFLADYRKPIYVHNTYLDILVEVGIIGLFLWAGLFISVLFYFYLNRDFIFARAGIVSIIIIMTHSLFDTPLFSVHLFLVLVLLISIASFYEQEKNLTN